VRENPNLSNQRSLLGVACLLACALVVALGLPMASRAQDTGYISGTVTDKSGAAVAGAEVVISSVGGNLTRTASTNADGAYVVAALSGGAYDIKVTAKGFETYQAKAVKLDVAQKIRVDVQLTVGKVTEQVVVEGSSVAQVETQSSDLSGTILGSQITQLQLNGRNFVQLAALVPGATNQTGQDEGTVGVYGNADYSINGGRTEYNNWEVDGGDNMDNGSNHTLNVYPSVDALAEFKVLTSNYGAQYGRNASGTIEVETKSGTNSFHGDVYYFGRNDAFNARNFFDDPTQPTPQYKKHDYGYTVGGPVFIPNHYNSNKEKTFFFFSEEWHRDLVPGQVFNVPVPSLAERGQASTSTPGFANFTDLCPNANFPNECPNVANPAAVPIDVNGQALLAVIPKPNVTDPAAALGRCGGIACFDSSPAQATHWREELVRLDHNFSPKLRATFRYIHDSWNTVTPTVLWAGGSFPNVETNFVGPGTSFVSRLNATISPTLLNEFVASYTADHIFLTNTGSGVVSASSAGLAMPHLFSNFGNKLPDINVQGGSAYGGGFSEGQAYIPWNNANPTYTIRDNVTKILGVHTLQFGVYGVLAQKNEQSSFGSIQGVLTFNNTSGVTSGNSFADLLQGNIASFQQVSVAPKYYFRYKIAEPYFQDDWRITKRITLNLGLRLSLLGTYHEKLKQAFNFEPSVFKAANAPFIDDGSVTGTEGALLASPTGPALSPTDPRNFNGLVQCGAAGQPSGCVQGHLFNAAPRFGFAWDPWGNGKWAVRGGYGIFYDHGNGNEQNVEALEATPPLVLNPSQPNIQGYSSIGGGAGGPILSFPLGFNAVNTKAGWPYVQQWNLNIQHDLPQHVVASIAYVGSKGTHLGLRYDLNQLVPLQSSQNPFGPSETLANTGPIDPTTNLPVGACAGPAPFTNPGQPWGAGQTVVGTNSALTTSAANHLNIACGVDAAPFRPYVGFSDINFESYRADSIYNAFQFSARRSIAPLTFSVAYTYSHSIDDASDGGAGNLSSIVNAYNLRLARASSDFDERHVLTISYVYDLPFLRHATGFSHALLADWHFSGITTMQTGLPFSVKYSGASNNAGVSNASVNNGAGGGVSIFADLVSGVSPHSTLSAACAAGDPGTGPLLFNPCAFAAPQGLTFGNSGRNFLNMPRRTNFDMSLLKHFKLNETTGFEFRAEAFNIFNHTQWAGSSIAGASINNDQAGSSFLHPSAAHRARTLQLALKFLF
jgi:hypothetical protein